MLGYSQSAVTVQIRLLENELETKLFDRMGKKISLTPQGTQFYEHCNRILYELEWIMLSMKTNQELKDSLHIGTIASLCTVKFPSLLDKFHSLYPKVNIKITLDAPEKLIQMMEQHNGLSFLPYFAVEKYIQNGDLAMLDIKEIEISMYRQIFYHKDKFCTREMKEFIRLVKESENDHSQVIQ